MDEQRILSCRRVAALLAHVQLVASLLVGVLQGDAVDLLHVGLQRAALGEGLVAEVALVWTDACMCAHMSFEVEGVVEAFAAEATQVSLCLVVTLDVSVQHPLVLESLLANLAHERSRRPTLTLTRGSGHHWDRLWGGWGRCRRKCS